MAALTISAVEARASLIESSVEMVRVQIERNTLALTGAAYLCLADYELHRLRSELNAALPQMPHAKIDEVANVIERGCASLNAHARRLDVSMLTPFERWNHRRILVILGKVNVLAVYIREEALRKRPYMPIAMESPSLNPAVYRDAAMASLMFRRATPDPAESYPDPDYGF